MVNRSTPLAGHNLQDVKGNLKTTQTRQLDVSLFAINGMSFKTIAVWRVNTIEYSIKSEKVPINFHL